MQDSERVSFLELVSDVLAFYKQPFNKFVGDVWWQALKVYDLAAVRQAFSRHAVNPDAGQFPPKPADVVRMIGGTTGDAALVAWSKVERAIRCIGQYESVIFDDPLIHRVAEDMGGWVKLCSYPDARALETGGKEFQNRYRGFAMRSERPPYPRALIGHAQAQNQIENVAAKVNYRMLGEPDRCIQVYQFGNDDSDLPIALLEASARVPQLENKSNAGK